MTKHPTTATMSDLEIAAEQLWFFREQLVEIVDRSRASMPVTGDGTEFLHVDSAGFAGLVRMLDEATSQVFRCALPPLLAIAAYQPPPPLAPHPAMMMAKPALRVIDGGRT